MEITIRDAGEDDLPFLREMLYEAIFWRKDPDKPDFDEAMELDFVQAALDGWGHRNGDMAVVALRDTIPVGAAWYRYWTAEDDTRGFIEADIPVLAIAVHSDHRNRGLGGMMVDHLLGRASDQSIDRISLCVAKDNYAIRLYRGKGFRIHKDIESSVLMIRDIAD